jgi:hypothetical protein
MPKNGRRGGKQAMNDKIREIGELAIIDHLTNCVSNFSGFVCFQQMKQTRTKIKIFCEHVAGDFVLSIEKSNLRFWRCHFYAVKPGSNNPAAYPADQKTLLIQETKIYIAPALRAIQEENFSKFTTRILCRALQRDIHVVHDMLDWPQAPGLKIQLVKFEPERLYKERTALVINVVRLGVSNNGNFRKLCKIHINPENMDWLTTNCFSAKVKKPSIQFYVAVSNAIDTEWRKLKRAYDVSLGRK